MCNKHLFEDPSRCKQVGVWLFRKLGTDAIMVDRTCPTCTLNSSFVSKRENAENLRSTARKSEPNEAGSNQTGSSLLGTAIFFAMFDADMMPEADIVRALMPYALVDKELPTLLEVTRPSMVSLSCHWLEERALESHMELKKMMTVH